MIRIRSIRISSLVSALFSCLVSCGGSDEFAFSFVSDFSVSPGTTKVGDQATVVVVFESSTRSTFNELTGANDTDLAISIPRGVDMVEDSSELEGTSDFNSRTPNLITQCENGSHAILYNFRGSELSAQGQNRLRLKVKPTEERGTVTFKAEAESFIPNPCTILGQNSGTLVINPS